MALEVPAIVMAAPAVLDIAVVIKVQGERIEPFLWLPSSRLAVMLEIRLDQLTLALQASPFLRVRTIIDQGVGS